MVFDAVERRAGGVPAGRRVSHRPADRRGGRGRGPPPGARTRRGGRGDRHRRAGAPPGRRARRRCARASRRSACGAATPTRGRLRGRPAFARRRDRARSTPPRRRGSGRGRRRRDHLHRRTRAVGPSGHARSGRARHRASAPTAPASRSSTRRSFVAPTCWWSTRSTSAWRSVSCSTRPTQAERAVELGSDLCRRAPGPHGRRPAHGLRPHRPGRAGRRRRQRRDGACRRSRRHARAVTRTRQDRTTDEWAVLLEPLARRALASYDLDVAGVSLITNDWNGVFRVDLTDGSSACSGSVCRIGARTQRSRVRWPGSQPSPTGRCACPRRCAPGMAASRSTHRPPAFRRRGRARCSDGSRAFASPKR